MNLRSPGYRRKPIKALQNLGHLALHIHLSPHNTVKNGINEPLQELNHFWATAAGPSTESIALRRNNRDQTINDQKNDNDKHIDNKNNKKKIIIIIIILLLKNKKNNNNNIKKNKFLH